jgi:hypothetical protein
MHVIDLSCKKERTNFHEVTGQSTLPMQFAVRARVSEKYLSTWASVFNQVGAIASVDQAFPGDDALDVFARDALRRLDGHGAFNHITMNPDWTVSPVFSKATMSDWACRLGMGDIVPDRIHVWTPGTTAFVVGHEKLTTFVAFDEDHGGRYVLSDLDREAPYYAIVVFDLDTPDERRFFVSYY